MRLALSWWIPSSPFGQQTLHGRCHCPSLTLRPIIIMCVNVAQFRELALSVSDSKQHFKSFWYVHCRPFSLYILASYVWNLSRPATATTTEWRKIKIEIIEWEIYWFILDQHSHSLTLSMQSAVGNRTNINFSSWVDVCARCYWLRVEWRRPSWAHRRGRNRKEKSVLGQWVWFIFRVRFVSRMTIPTRLSGWWTESGKSVWK